MHPELEQMAEVYKALADVNRLKIIKLLASEMEERVNVGKLAEILHISQPAASQHIKILKVVGLLTRTKVGNSAYYQIDNSKMLEIKRRFEMLFEIAYKKCAHFPDCNGDLGDGEDTGNLL